MNKTNLWKLYFKIDILPKSGAIMFIMQEELIGIQNLRNVYWHSHFSDSNYGGLKEPVILLDTMISLDKQAVA